MIVLQHNGDENRIFVAVIHSLLHVGE